MNDKEKLKIKQAYPLEIKIELTKKAIREFIDVYGYEGVYIPYSGGKDSTVLLDIVRKEFGDTIPAVFSNTKNEFKSIIDQVEFAKRHYKNVQIVMSDMSIEDVIKKVGYPVVSKKVSRMLHDIKNPTDKNIKSRTLYLSDYALDKDGSPKIKKDKNNNPIYDENNNPVYVKNTSWKIAQKHRYLIDSPFNISEKCCDYLKKKPMAKYEKETGRKPMIAILATESSAREDSWLRHGCNQFNASKPKSIPLAFWTEQDVLKYLKDNNVKIASVYGDIVQDEYGNYSTTGESRVGCVACLLGMEFERKDEKNRIQRLKEIEPKKYDYVVNRLGFKDVLEYMNYKY
jgi:3'-phosphoadenosine 5'-phosphosulfate sulfotransferase (PAPS reductase)/FAD synthetase